MRVRSVRSVRSENEVKGAKWKGWGEVVRGGDSGEE